MKPKKRPLIEEDDSHVRPGLGPQYVDRVGLDRPSFFSSPRNALGPPARDGGKISLDKKRLPTSRMSTPTQGGAAKRLLHEIAAQKYSAFLTKVAIEGQASFPPLSNYRRPKRKRQRPDMMQAPVVLRVPVQQAVEGSHIQLFAPEWRKPMSVEPEQLGAFLKPGGGVVEPTTQPPPEVKVNNILGKDLNQGYMNYVEPDSTSSTSEIAEILDETPGLEREEDSTHFLTYRNNLNKLLVTPYSKQKWEMEVFKEGGVINMEVVTLDRSRGKLDRTSYWGRRFETLCVLGVEGARLDDQQRVPEDPARPSYCVLYRSRLGGHNILMGAEIDACRPGEPGKFVEIKTTRLISQAKDEQIFKKHKCLKYWAQCYLAGVKDLIVGYRDDQGIVRDIKPWTTDGLVETVDKAKRVFSFSLGYASAPLFDIVSLSEDPDEIRLIWQHWDKDVCLNFADRCLSFLKDNVDEGIRYSFKFVEPFDHLILEPIPPPSNPSAGPVVPPVTLGGM